MALDKINAKQEKKGEKDHILRVNEKSTRADIMAKVK